MICRQAGSELLCSVCLHKECVCTDNMMSKQWEHALTTVGVISFYSHRPYMRKQNVKPHMLSLTMSYFISTNKAFQKLHTLCFHFSASRLSFGFQCKCYHSVHPLNIYQLASWVCTDRLNFVLMLVIKCHHANMLDWDGERGNHYIH